MRDEIGWEFKEMMGGFKLGYLQTFFYFEQKLFQYYE
jgi:hypothetical protein